MPARPWRAGILLHVPGFPLAALVRTLVADVEDHAIFLLDPVGRIVTWNEGARRLTGYIPDEVVGRDVRLLWPADEQATLEELARDEPAATETFRVRKDGSSVRVEASITVLRDEEGAVAGYAEVARPIGAMRDLYDLRSVVEAIRDYAIILLDSEGRIRSWNRGARLIKGWEASEIVGEHFSRFYTEEDVARSFPDHELAVARREGRFEDEGWRVHKDGSRFWANVVITALYDDDDEVVGFAKITRDLTDRRAAEEELRSTAVALAESNEGLRPLQLAIASIRDYAIFLLDPDGHVLTWNEGARRIKGYEEAEIVGSHFSRFYTSEDLDTDHPARELEVAARVGRFEDEGWRVRKDGSQFWASVVITAVRSAENGELIGFAKVTRDLTERRAAEEELRASASSLARTNAELAPLRLAVSTIRDYAIFLLGPAGHVVTWNEGARRIKGYEESEIVGSHFSRFYTEPDLARDFPAHELEIAARAGRFEDEGWRVRKDGSQFWANVVITAMNDASGKLIGFAKVTRDLTQRREAEEDLKATAAELERSNAELERFAAAAAHDLVQPLHTIVGLTDLIDSRAAGVLDPVALEAVEHVRAAGVRLTERVDALLRYARSLRTSVAVRAVRVDDALDQVLVTLARPISERGAAVVRSGDLGVVSADPALLEVVLQNLIANALKFTVETPHITISCAPDGPSSVRVSVRDDGIGIPESEQERIFGLFTRAHEEASIEGIGMGLPLCRQIVERHGGTMGVSSPGAGGGSTFWFTLPAG